MLRIPLATASVNGHTECVELLLKHRASVNAVDKDQRTHLMLAAADNHVECIECLHKGHAQLDAKDAGGKTAIVSAIEAVSGGRRHILASRADGRDASVQLPDSSSQGRDHRLWQCERHRSEHVDVSNELFGQYCASLSDYEELRFLSPRS